ncbi:MAG TPA: class D sortase [Anaerolineales bacterium]|nr:class D sortase [Anaerolineales bacterium]
MQDLSVDELRWLLVEKRRAARSDRLERYRQTGRVVQIAPEPQPISYDRWQTGAVDEDDGEAPTTGRSGQRRILDGFLLVVEVGAVIGFLFVLLNGLNVIRELNREVISALEQPRLTPTPLVMALVLPSGHTPPNSPGGAQPNDAEIPEHLRPMVQSLAPAAAPTPGPQQAVRIQAPAINVDAPVVQGDGWEQLKKGVGQHLGTANPGEPGNVVLSAHNDIFGEIFRDLDRLKPGDEIVVYTNQRAYSYRVVNIRIVEPTQVEVMAPTREATVTLISCYPYLVDDQRIVVTARLAGN